MQKLGFGSVLMMLGIWPILFYYYLGNFRAITFVSYVICLVLFLSKLSLNKNENKKSVLLSSILFLEFVIGAITFGDPLSHIFSFRLIYGFGILMLAYLYFVRIEVEKIFLLLAIVTIIEKLLLIVEPSLIYILPNYDGGVTFSLENAQSIIGGVHSFGGNRTVSGVILFAGYIYSLDKPISRLAKLLILFASIVCMSGTALLFFALYLPCLAVIKIRKRSTFFGKILTVGVFSVLFIFLAMIFFVENYEDLLFDRFSLFYINYIYEYKLEQIVDYDKAVDVFGLIFGLGSAAFTSTSDEIAGYGSRYGDFIALDFLARYGALGFMALVALIAVAINRKSFLPMMIIIGGTLHYHVLFSGPGQVMSALMLANAVQSRKFAKENSKKENFRSVRRQQLLC